MKSTICKLGLCALALGFVTLSCNKEENPYADDVTPTVTLTTDETAFVADQAVVRLTLDHFIHSDVTVRLKAETGGEDITTAVTPNEYTIEAGAVKKDITLSLNEELAPLGSYPVNITLDEVTGAKVSATASAVSLGMVNKDETVLTVTPANFNGNEASLTFTLGKPLATNAAIVLVTAGDSEVTDEDLTYDKTVVIPAGARTIKASVVVNLDNLDFGISDAVINIARVDNRLTTKETGFRLQARVDLILEEHTEWTFGVSDGSLYAYQYKITDPKLYYALIPVSEVSGNLEAKVQEGILDAFSRIKAGTVTPFDWEGAQTYDGSTYKYFGETGAALMMQYYLVLFTLDENNRATGRYGVTDYVTHATETSDTWWMYYYYASYDYVYHYIYSAASTGYYILRDNVALSVFDSYASIEAYIKEVEAQVQDGTLTLASATGYSGGLGYHSSLDSGTYYGMVIEFTEEGKATGYYQSTSYVVQ